MHNYVIVVGGGKDSVFVIDKIHRMGLKAIVVDKNPVVPGMICADEKIVSSTYESEPIIKKLKKFIASGKKIVAIVTRSSGIPVITTAKIADALNLFGAGEDAARVLTYKNLFTDLCYDNGIPTARIKMSDFKKRNKYLTRYFPCVIKPALGLAGKVDVRMITKDLKIGSVITAVKKKSLNGKILIERYIPGIDISLFSVVFNGVLCPCFFLRELNKFDKEGKIKFKGFCFCSKLKNIEKKRMIKIAQKVVKVADVGFSPFLISFRLTKEGLAVPIEVNLDFGGENVLEELIFSRIDFDFIECYLESIIHKAKPDIPKIFYKNFRN
ncbi:MAG: hypothetical protein PHY40_02820 [Patescibacteria group bacterium]|nr:hypothetical protein [Patescibacteria group bacterium]